MNRRLVLAGVLAVVCTIAVGRTVQADHTPNHTAQLGLEGYCPVCIIEARKWVPGRPEHESVYDGVTYRFPGAGEKAKFDQNPSKYVPALGGDCTVCLSKAGKRMPGNIRHAAIYQNRLFLFPGEGEKKVFLNSPKMFANVDLAEEGNCIVCRVKAGKTVPGKAEFTAIHDGKRYQFPSNAERQMFERNPEQFLTAQVKMEAANQVMIAGRSGCAACEHGITPVGSPDELGLAVNTPDGKIYVVEDAHKLYPGIYKNRFAQVSLQLSGEVIKQQGKVTWVKPAKLQTVN